MNDLPRITVAFNAALFLYCVALGLMRFLLLDKAKGIPLEGLFITSILDTARFLVVMFITAYFVREIWNRFVTAIFAVRNVNTKESIALVLLTSVLTG